MKKRNPYFSVRDSREYFKSQTGIMRFVKELLLDNYKIYDVKQKRGELVPYHTHAHKEMILVVEGSLRLIVEEEIIDLKGGELITIEAWAIHLACFPFEDAHFFLCFDRNGKFS